MKLIEPLPITDTGAFSRASVASYYTAAGGVAFATVNEPRLNHPPETHVYAPAGWMSGPSLLLPTQPLPGMTVIPKAVPEFLAEAAGTNVMLQSQDLTGWTATEATVATDIGVAPDGTTTSDIVRPSAVSQAIHQVARMGSVAVVAAGGKAGGAVFLRAAGFSTVRVRMATAGEAAGVEMIVNLSTGAIPYAGPFGTGSTFGTARVRMLAGGWRRLEIEGAVAGATTLGLVVNVGDGTQAFAGDGVAGVEVWGHDVKAGPVSSYVATTTTAVTRAADVGMPMLVSSVAENEPVYSAATPYSKNQTVRGNTAATAHRLFVSVKDSNTGNPLSDKTSWLPAGSTNRWRMFDQVVGSQTADADGITVVLNLTKRVTAIALFAVDAATCRATITDPVDGVVRDITVSLVSTAGIDNWYSYFFNDIERASQALLLNLPPYAGAQLTLTLSNPGYAVRCGACVVGKLQQLGATQYGASVGIIDTSIKGRDDFGNAVIVERPYYQRADLPVRVKNSFVSQLVRKLASYHATPIVYIGSELFEPTVIYGFYKDFDVVIRYTEDSDLSLQLESLV